MILTPFTMSNQKHNIMSELFSAVTPAIYEKAVTMSVYLVERGVEPDNLWRLMGRFIRLARREYRRQFVDWFGPHHVEQAQRELADAILADLRG